MLCAQERSLSGWNSANRASMLLSEWGGWAEVVLGSRQRGKKRIWYLRMGEEGEREARKKQSDDGGKEHGIY